jgi:thiamine kinase-like enzyme
MSHIGFNKYIDFVITSDDCEIGKPSPQPYMKAIDKYCTTSDKCFIFEDSKTGILSAMSVNPKLVIGVETLYSNKELKQYGIQKSILNYVNLTYNDIINTIDEDLVDLKNIIKNNVLMNVTEIVINNNKLKGGYIADVIGVALKDCSTSHNFVLKYENKTENSLSFMAKKLDLYEREYYFYETVSKHVNIKIPKYICVVRDDKRENFGILLENLLVENHFTINLNLSNESIDVSLKIVESMALLHSNFWNKNLRLIFPKLKSTIDPIFRPFLKDFIFNKIDLFKEKWGNILNDKIYLCDKICEDFENIQYRLSESNITFIHGDIKSPNIIYDRSNNDEPYFIDWQHCGIGKGTQDVIFFIIESFDTNELPIIYPLIKSYYYKKLLENGIQNYSYKQYESDLIDSLFYIPFFTAVWFGTTPNDELIDKNFPFFFIQKLFFLYSII